MPFPSFGGRVLGWDPNGMRLYRGLTRPYRSGLVGTTAPYQGTDFTDCPAVALRYARGSRGTVVVLDVPASGESRLSEELWLGADARRIMVWGRFDPWIVGVLSAKDLREELRSRGVSRKPDDVQASVLTHCMERWLREGIGGTAWAPGERDAEGRRSRRPPGRRRCGELSTSTVDEAGGLVPWMAAQGPLAYCPEAPPDEDYFFQYSWVVPGIFADGTNKRCHFYFGAQFKDQARDLFDFWRAARQGQARRVAIRKGRITPEAVTAPLAAYHADAPTPWGAPRYLFIQHGSYLFVPVEDQASLESGMIHVYRGIGEGATFWTLRDGGRDPEGCQAWHRYLAVQGHVLADSVRSFNSIHDRTKRCETGAIRDRSWMTDEIAREEGLDIDGHGFDAELWRATHQSYTLTRWTAKWKFGPHYVACKTPMDNIRLTTFFAGESEVRIVDPRRLEVIEAHGCRVDSA